MQKTVRDYNPGISRKRKPRAKIKLPSFQVRHTAARLLDRQSAGRNIPYFFPMTRFSPRKSSEKNLRAAGGKGYNLSVTPDDAYAIRRPR